MFRNNAPFFLCNLICPKTDPDFNHFCIEFYRLYLFGFRHLAIIILSPEMVKDAQIPPSDGGEIFDEDIAQVLQQLIQSGEIDEKSAMDIMQAIQGGGAPGGDAGGAGGPPPGAGAPPDAGAAAPAGGPEGAPQPGGGSSGGAPGKPKKEEPKADDGPGKEASTIEGVIKASSTIADRLVAEMFK